MSITLAIPQPTAPQPVTEDQPITRLRKRDRYIDVLRCVALIRVMTYHVFGWVWLPILFPSMGIMFALAGSLIASSLDRSPGNPWRVLKKRGIRLLPPVWLFGLVVVTIMMVAGWTHSDRSGVPLSWQTMLFWLLPISDPPASSFGNDWVVPLWYVRTYLWFLLLSPAALWLFRHWPKRMMALPVGTVLLSAVGLLPLAGRSGGVILSIAMFGGCWMLGFAHHDNKIRPMPLVRVLLGGGALMALGLVWAFTHQDPVSGWDIDSIPVADTLYCLGAVLILLRLYPDFSWMERHVVLDKVVTVINSRAMTIYLWGNLAIFLSHPVLDAWSVTANLDQDNAVGWIQGYLMSWLIILACIFLFGWCEDLAARRQLRFNPWPRSKRQLETMRTRKVLTFPRPLWMADLTPKRLFIVTSCLLMTAGGVSAAALAGTNTPGRTNVGDVQPHFAFNPRALTTPPTNLGQGNGQKFKLPAGLEKVKSAVLGEVKSIQSAITDAPLAITSALPTVVPGDGSASKLLNVTKAPATRPGVTPLPGTPAPPPVAVPPPTPVVVPPAPPVVVPTPEPTIVPIPVPTIVPTTPEPTVVPTTPEPTVVPTTPEPTVVPTTPEPTIVPTVDPIPAPTAG
jgi:peptidoglycan/LPS O-acetylase OafA/YrhL